MTTTRMNPAGLMEVLHPETAAWVPAIALLQVAGGFNVKFSETQALQLQQISSGIGALQPLVNELGESNTLLELLKAASETMRNEIQNETNPTLAALLNRLIEVEAIESNSLAKLGMMEQELGGQNGVSALLNRINDKTANYLTQFAELSQKLTSLGELLDPKKVRPSQCQIFNVSLNSADKEFTVPLPANTKILSFKCRNNAGKACDIRYAFTINQVSNANAGLYRTLDAFNEFNENVGMLNGTLYIASSQVSSTNTFILEGEAWS